MLVFVKPHRDESLGGFFKLVYLTPGLRPPLCESGIIQISKMKRIHIKQTIIPLAVDSPFSKGCPQDGVLDSPHPQEGVLYSIFINNHPIITTPITQLPYNSNLKERARALRRAGNLSEVLFWMQVNKKGFHQIDFDRQRVIGNYIVDFYIKQLALVIEIDGSSHDNKVVEDRIREDYLMSLGLKIYRISVHNILHHLPDTMIALEDYIVNEYGVF